MRIYDGSPRQDFEEALRSIGAMIDQRGMRDVVIAETDAGFFVQALVISGSNTGGWSEQLGSLHKESLSISDDDVVRLMDEGVARRASGTPAPEWSASGRYEKALRVIGHWIDEQKPRDIFLLELEGAYIMRLFMSTPTGLKHVLAEFTKADIDEMITVAPSRRARTVTTPNR
ncbi:MAG: hypothetical protein ACRDF7_04285 [Candidatus Limnocylindrales bacterium]